MKRWMPRYTEQANDDLRDIWAYVAADNPVAADKLLMELLTLFEKVTDFPQLGRSVDWLVPGHRILKRGNYLMIYQLLSDQQVVELVRVVHSARNWPALFDA